jgi:hypothetical protein
MSRGYGWVQRRILEVLDAAASNATPPTTSQLTEAVFHDRPLSEAETRMDWLRQMVAREESVKRALRKLKAEGRVQVDEFCDTRWWRWRRTWIISASPRNIAPAHNTYNLAAANNT